MDDLTPKVLKPSLDRSKIIFEAGMAVSAIWPDRLWEFLRHPGEKWKDKRQKRVEELADLETRMNDETISDGQFLRAVMRWKAKCVETVELTKLTNKNT